MNMYPELVISLKSCVKSVADQCLCMELISTDTYDMIIMKPDLIDSDRARILLSNIRSNISLKTETLGNFLSALLNVGGLDNLVQEIRNCQSKGMYCIHLTFLPVQIRIFKMELIYSFHCSSSITSF